MQWFFSPWKISHSSNNTMRSNWAIVSWFTLWLCVSKTRGQTFSPQTWEEKSGWGNAFAEYCLGLSWHTSGHAAALRAALSPGCSAAQTSTWWLPAMRFFSSWITGVAWLIGSFPQIFLNNFTKSQQVNWYFSGAFHYEIVSNLMQVFKTQLKANGVFLEARSQTALQDSCSKRNRIHAHNPLSVHRLLVQITFAAQNKNN